MQLRKGSGLLFKYLLSYTSLALLCTLTVSFLALYLIGRVRTEASVQSTKEKMQLVLQDSANQQEQFAEIVLDIATSFEFNRRMFMQNKYYEINMLDKFSRYNNYSPIAREYFMFYHDEPELIYRMRREDNQAWSAVFNYYAQDHLLVQNIDLLKNRLLLRKTAGLYILDLENFGGPANVFLWCYNFYTAGWTQTSAQTTICFLVDKNELEKRVKFVSGGVGDRYSLLYGDILLAGVNIPEIDRSALIISDSGDQFKMTIDITSDKLYEMSSFYEKISGIVFAVFSLISLGTGIYLAYRSYSPINKLINKFSRLDSKSTLPKNELKEIEDMLQTAYTDVQSADRRFNEQLATLRAHLLMLLINGINSDQAVNNLWILHDKLRGPYFCVLCVNDKLEHAQTQALFTQVEEFSDDEITIYSCCWEGNYGRVLLLSMVDAENYHYALQSLQEIYDANNYTCKIGIGGVYSNINEIHKSYHDAINNIEHEGEVKSDNLAELAILQNSEKMTGLLNYVNEHIFEWEFSLSSMAEAYQLNATTFSKMFRHVVGMNFKEYIIKIRVKEAKQLLAQSDLSVAEICTRVGYGNLSHFIKMFKKTVGETPSIYRNEAKQKL